LIGSGCETGWGSREKQPNTKEDSKFHAEAWEIVHDETWMHKMQNDGQRKSMIINHDPFVQ
jgi:hypothetical protein